MQFIQHNSDLYSFIIICICNLLITFASNKAQRYKKIDKNNYYSHSHSTHNDGCDVYLAAK